MEMIIKSELVAKYIIGSGIILLHIIIVYGLPYFVMNAVNGLRDSNENKIIIIIYPMCMFFQAVKYNNPRKNCI